MKRSSPGFQASMQRRPVAVCELDYEQVREVCRLLATRKWCMHTDLGIYMNRHSTVASYLHLLLAAICGRLCVPGGNPIPGSLMPLGAHTDERDPKTWRTVTTDFPALMGVFPPNVLPEEILSDHKDRTRISDVLPVKPPALVCRHHQPTRRPSRSSICW